MNRELTDDVVARMKRIDKGRVLVGLETLDRHRFDVHRGPSARPPIPPDVALMFVLLRCFVLCALRLCGFVLCALCFALLLLCCFVVALLLCCCFCAFLFLQIFFKNST